MFDLWRERRGRRAAVGAIGPQVERSRRRHHGNPDDAWMRPYLLGFLGTLITLVARREQPGLGDPALGNVQSEAWARITGLGPALVGEEICLLSAACDRAFLDGCRNAGELFGAMVAAEAACTALDYRPDPASSEQIPAMSEEHPRIAEARDLWERHFDGHLT